MKRLSSRHMPRLVAEIQYAPWLDLMILMLLTFLVLTTAWQPSAGHGASTASPKEQIELVVSPDLTLSLAGQALEAPSLIRELTQRVQKNPELGVITTLPANLSAANLLKIMDALREAKVKHTAVRTQPAASTTPLP